MQTKQCSECKEVKPVSDFNKHRFTKDKLQPNCKACRAAYDRRYHQEHHERVLERMNEYYAEHREEIQKQQSSSIKRKERHNRWIRENPQKAGNHLRREREKDILYDLTRDDIERIKAAGCFICGSHADLTIAHDKPVAKGGNTTRGNVFCLCRACNARMGTKTLAQKIKQLLFPF